MSPNEILYISDGDDDDNHEISFVGSSNLSRTINAIRSIPIVLDAEDDDEPIPGPSCPSSPDEPLPNILDLLRSDGPDFDIPPRVTKASKTKITVDRKGKGKEIVLVDERYEDVDEFVKRKSKRARSRSRSSDVMIGMGNSYIVEGLSRPIGRVESKKRARSPEPERSETRAVEAIPQQLSKAEKEALKADEKKRKQLEKDKAKADKEAEKSFQRKVADANRLRTSKNDTLREIHLYLSADLHLPSCPIAGALPEITHRITDNLSEIHYLPEAESPIPGIVRFKRHVKSRYDHVRKAWIPLDEARWEWDGTLLAIITADEVVDMIGNGKSKGEGLREWAGDVRLAMGMRATDQLVIMIKGLGKYYSKLKSLQNREFTAAARAGVAGKDIALMAGMSSLGREEIEVELLRLEMENGAFLVHVEKTEDIEDWIFNLAGDIAIRPYKLLSKSHLSFCATDGIKKGQTPGDVFELMLQEVQGVTPSAAAGIRAEYTSFKVLMDAYERAEKKGRERAEMLLQDCEIKNLRNGTASGRRLGKAVSKKVYNVFRGQDSLALV